MLPARFTLHRPRTIAQALDLMATHGEDATYYAGGTEMLIAMKARVVLFPHVIDLKGIDELRGIEVDEEGARIGALATHHQISRDEGIRRGWPAYARLSHHVANVRVRIAGTLGGNLCFAEPHADPPTLLSALQARLHLVSPRGARAVPMHEFTLGEFTTAREPDEILCGIELPALPAGAGAAYHSFGHAERPAVGAAAVCLPGAQGPSWRLWVGAMTSRPTALPELEAALAGLPPAQAAEQAARLLPQHTAALEAQSDVHGGADYKRHLAGVLMQRAIVESHG